MSATLRGSVDVIIVGAGLAGLAAAEAIVAAGRTAVVLEGRKRTGGRVHAVEVAGVAVEAGATWVGAHHSEVRDLASKLGCELVPQFHEGKGIISFGGRRRVESLTALAPWAMLDIGRILKSLQKLADQLPCDEPWNGDAARELDAMTLAQWLSDRWALEDTRRFVNMISLVHWGAPAEDVSLFNALKYIRNFGSVDVMLKVEGGDQQDRVLGTTSVLVRRLAESIDAQIHVNSPVDRIITAADRVRAEAGGRAFDASYAIVTASPAHRTSIRFDPPLPEAQYGLSRAWRLGALSKAFVAYESPFWRNQGLSGEAISDDELVFLTFDVSPDDTGPGVLVAFCSGNAFDGMSKDARRDRVVQQLVHLYGPDAMHPIDYTDFAWGNDYFAPGGPNPAVAPGAWSAFGRLLREPVGRIHWAGTETQDESGGTMNGAILSGRRAAKEVLALLSDAD